MTVIRKSMSFLWKFWVKIKSRISKSKRGVAQLTETVKLEAQISELEKQIEQQYVLIGRAYYTTHAEAPEPEVQDAAHNIRACTEKIEELKIQLNKAKEVVVCPNCGKELAENAPFCAFCGHRIPKSDPIRITCSPCRACGAIMQDNQMYCTNCGTQRITNDVGVL